MKPPSAPPPGKHRVKTASEPEAPKRRKEKGDSAKARENGVQVLARAAEMLRLLKNAPAGLTQAEMAVPLGLARTTVHRIVSALYAEQLVEPIGKSGRFRLGQEILRMGDAVRSTLMTEIHPHLQALSAAINETVDLSVLERGQAVFVDQVVAPHRLSAVSSIGAAFPLYCTANGKALLAAMPPAEANRLLPRQLAAMTPNTITELSALQKEMVTVRETGVAFDNEEHSLGICAIGIALSGTPLGPTAISIPIPVQRFEEKKKHAVTALKATARRIETSLHNEALQQ
ncbi:MAG: IclR family transcriptional regulator [Alphaproteobacteria bacterium]|nr:IclR family transcriptional regulator [Alphaproteobacteria bacterium]MBU6472501.1 IclR family transcriptional regulator [Alphaproteobacteria bacterium]MDE2011863.1 IclR family transcriptional regulator [Alphaproteobacteria bacterium]MDE2075170.1 IclR family transcriptional regulator [Alphaproteobacteria bacterium]MDE2351709.1 IclR family transcriptional regulator [Alphaproteobacteria bacterium]